MQENVYAVPESNLDISPAPARQMFYVVSKAKFLVLFFSTFSLYGVYWNFKNWSCYKSYHNDDMWPIMRAIFSVFFTHSLFSEIDFRLKKMDTSFTWNASVLATFVVIILILSNVIDRIATYANADWLMLLAFPILIVHGLLLLKAQRAINIACEDPEGLTNKTFTGLNWMWIILGVVFTVTTIAGSVLFFLYPESA